MCWVREQGKGDEPKTGKKGKSKETTKKRLGKAKNPVESDPEEDELQPVCESEDEADALPVIAPIPALMEGEGASTRSRSCTYTSTPSRLSSGLPGGDIIDPSTPPCSPKKRKVITEVIISTPSPRKRFKILQRSDSPKI